MLELIIWMEGFFMKKERYNCDVFFATGCHEQTSDVIVTGNVYMSPGTETSVNVFAEENFFATQSKIYGTIMSRGDVQIEDSQLKKVDSGGEVIISGKSIVEQVFAIENLRITKNVEVKNVRTLGEIWIEIGAKVEKIELARKVIRYLIG